VNTSRRTRQARNEELIEKMRGLRLVGNVRRKRRRDLGDLGADTKMDLKIKWD
jgi:hypothetical protein